MWLKSPNHVFKHTRVQESLIKDAAPTVTFVVFICVIYIFKI